MRFQHQKSISVHILRDCLFSLLIYRCKCVQVRGHHIRFVENLNNFYRNGKLSKFWYIFYFVQMLFKAISFQGRGRNHGREGFDSILLYIVLGNPTWGFPHRRHSELYHTLRSLLLPLSRRFVENSFYLTLLGQMTPSVLLMIPKL